MILPWIERLIYLGVAMLFITGIKQLQNPETARNGNRLSAAGMMAAIIMALLSSSVVSYGAVLGGLVAGGSIGLILARRVQMTSMPQLVALLNGASGGAALLIAVVEYLRVRFIGGVPDPLITAMAILGLIAGGITLTGSIIAFAKLQELMSGRAIVFPGIRVITIGITVAAAALGAWAVMVAGAPLWVFYVLISIALVLGLLIVVPIGGADMPVVIALLNSLSGIAVAMSGFVLSNEVLVITGALVGTSGFMLTQIMCRAMNRSLGNVIFGAFGATVSQASGDATGLTVNATTVEDAAVQLAYAQQVIIVPGYGLAVAQAQHQVRELMELIEKQGGTVKFAVHPVAGRMPGHMNVLLAEANIDYDKLRDMDDINPEFERADVCLVIGANDVVNPAARTDTSSPIYGMPILNADYAKRTIVLKRGMSAGFAGIENALFYNPKTQMLFGDAKGTITKLVSEIKQL